MEGWFSALAAYSVQLLIAVAVASAVQAVARVSDPAIRLAWWRSVALLCLALPLIPQPTPGLLLGEVMMFTVPAGDVVDAATASGLGWAALLMAVVMAGAAARVGWLLAGAARLRRLRRETMAVDLGPEVNALAADLAPHAEFRASAAIRQPVTFGLRHPVILVPHRLLSMTAEERRAVACHELLHVARRDWPWIVIEEHARALFWFHPGVWWLVEQIHVSREQLIDRLVVSRLQSRRAYMSALFAFGDSDTRSPSITFVRPRHLRTRLRQLSQEPAMSRTRALWTAAASMLVTAVAAAGAARAVPLDASAALAAQPGASFEIRLAEAAPGPGLSPAVVTSSGRSIYLHPGAVAVSTDIASAGVIEWTPGFAVAVRFTELAAARLADITAGHVGRPLAVLVDGRVVSAPTLRAPIADVGVINGLSEDEARSLAATLDPAAAQRERVADAVEAGVIAPRLIHHVMPSYTPEAMTAGIEGVVVLDAVVNADGGVEDVRVVRSLDRQHGLDEQAVEAAEAWNFVPGTRGGVPVAVRVRLEMEFTMGTRR